MAYPTEYGAAQFVQLTVLPATHKRQAWAAHVEWVFHPPVVEQTGWYAVNAQLVILWVQLTLIATIVPMFLLTVSSILVIRWRLESSVAARARPAPLTFQ
jgi:hypothetical protein